MIAFILALILFATPVMGMNLHSAMMMVTKQQSACSSATNEVGDRTEYAGSLGMGTNFVSCVAYTADCSGNLAYAYAFHQGTTSENLKVFVASKTGASPEDETIISNAGVITSTTDSEWAKSSAKLTGAVTASTAYWLCWVSDTNFSMYLQTTGTVSRWYNPITGSYATPTTNAGDAWTESTTNEFSIYVEIE